MKRVTPVGCIARRLTAAPLYYRILGRTSRPTNKLKKSFGDGCRCIKPVSTLFLQTFSCFSFPSNRYSTFETLDISTTSTKPRICASRRKSRIKTPPIQRNKHRINRKGGSTRVTTTTMNLSRQIYSPWWPYSKVTVPTGVPSPAAALSPAGPPAAAPSHCCFILDQAPYLSGHPLPAVQYVQAQRRGQRRRQGVRNPSGTRTMAAAPIHLCRQTATLLEISKLRKHKHSHVCFVCRSGFWCEPKNSGGWL